MVSETVSLIVRHPVVTNDDDEVPERFRGGRWMSFRRTECDLSPYMYPGKGTCDSFPSFGPPSRFTTDPYH